MPADSPTNEAIQAVMLAAMKKVRVGLTNPDEARALDEEIVRLEEGPVDMGETGWAVMREAAKGLAALSASPAIEGALQPQAASVPTEQAGGPVVGEEVLALRKALQNLAEACRKADAMEELSECVDGSLLDAADAALELQYPVIWTPEQVAMLQERQRIGHPYTCGGNRSDAVHEAQAEEDGDHDTGILIPTTRGWICPACDYRQFWAHEVPAPSTTSAAEQVGRYITFNPSSEEGNAVVSPEVPADGVYWTLIGSGPDLEQNALAAEIVRRLNAPTPGEGVGLSPRGSDQAPQSLGGVGSGEGQVDNPLSDGVGAADPGSLSESGEFVEQVGGNGNLDHVHAGEGTTSGVSGQGGEGEAPVAWEFTPLKGVWRNQSLSRLERVKAHRAEFRSSLKEAIDAVDEEAARQTLASRPPPATPEGLREKVATILVNQTPIGAFGYTREASLIIATRVADAILAALQPQAQPAATPEGAELHLRAFRDGLRIYRGNVRVEGPWSWSEASEALAALAALQPQAQGGE